MRVLEVRTSRLCRDVLERLTVLAVEPLIGGLHRIVVEQSFTDKLGRITFQPFVDSSVV